MTDDVAIADSDSRLLLTPGPLTTSRTVRAAMLRDWASRDVEFIELTAAVRKSLCIASELPSRYVSVPLQGCGTSALEACVETLIGPQDFAVVLDNGAYGKRLTSICQRLGKRHEVLTAPENEPLPTQRLSDLVRAGAGVTHVLAVHCETSSGLLNDMTPVLAALDGTPCRLILDAMSSFGAIPLPAHPALLAVVASANKCLEGVPGVGFALIEQSTLERPSHRPRSLTLDVVEQYRSFERTGEWRFTPPTHVVAALAQALREHAAEGGVEARRQRYARNHEALVTGMLRLGVRPFLPPELQSPIIVSFRMPGEIEDEFAALYAAVRARGVLLYPGKLTQAPTFRVGCIGHVFPSDMQRAVEAITLGVAALTQSARSNGLRHE